MKNVKKSCILTFLLMLGIIFSFDASAKSIGEMRAVARGAAEKAAYKEMKRISPNTGEDPNYYLVDDSFSYESGVIVCVAN